VDLIRATRHFAFAHKELFQDWCGEGARELANLLPSAERESLIQTNALRAAPRCVDGPIASGPTLAASQVFVKWLKKRNRKFLAVEMESGGALAAIYERAEPARSLVLRGISDYGDERKSQLDRVRGGALRRYAMRNAVRLLWYLLEVEELPRQKPYKDPGPLVPGESLPDPLSPPRQAGSHRTAVATSPFLVPFPRSEIFGREEELKRLHDIFRLPVRLPPRRRDRNGGHWQDATRSGIRLPSQGEVLVRGFLD
jgi:hypothetical protein